VAPSHPFGSTRAPRRGVSELYASMLMVGVTLTLGGLVASAAMGQLELANSSASLGATQMAGGVQLEMVYLVIDSSGSCPMFGGYHEGTSATLALYDYGTADFAPAEIAINGTVYAGTYGILGAGALGAYSLNLGKCVHSSGQTVIVTDSLGEEAEFGS